MYIAPYITRQEYECSCCFRLPPDFDDFEGYYQELFQSFRRLREEYGSSIPITSGYRCIKHNKEIGGVDCSEHVFGMALDIACTDKDDLIKKYEILQSVNPDLRIGLYPNKNFIHMGIGYRIRPRVKQEWQPGVVWGLETI